MRSNIDVLVSTGLGTRAQDDFLLARVTCVALLKLAKTHKVTQCCKPFDFLQNTDFNDDSRDKV